jgi:hypothetical protein
VHGATKRRPSRRRREAGSLSLVCLPRDRERDGTTWALYQFAEIASSEHNQSERFAWSRYPKRFSNGCGELPALVVATTDDLGETARRLLDDATAKLVSNCCPPILLPMMCCRASVAYIAFVDALRSDAANVESIHSAANTPRITLRSLAGRLVRSRSLTAEALARASLGVLP